MTRFGSMKAERTSRLAPPEAPEQRLAEISKPASRAGKKAISAYFSPDVSRALHTLALEQETTLQALMGEAFDDLMRKYGKHPLGER